MDPWTGHAGVVGASGPITSGGSGLSDAVVAAASRSFRPEDAVVAAASRSGHAGVVGASGPVTSGGSGLSDAVVV